MPSQGNTIKSWHKLALGTLLVLSGLGAAFLTIVARRDQNASLTTVAAILSLAIVFLIIILVLPPLVRSARLEIARVQLPFEITGGGVIFAGILVVVAIAAWNTGNNLLFLVFAILTSTMFVSWMAGKASLHDLFVSARFPDHIFAGESAPVIVTVQNRKRFLPAFSVLVQARGPLNLKQSSSKRPQLKKRTLAYFAYIPHRAGAEQKIEQTFEVRGHVVITGFELSSRFPFGFLRLHRTLRARDVDIVIYPKIQPSDDEMHLLPMNAGRVSSNRRGFGQDLLSLRDYEMRDDLRYIDWKATARSSRLTVREFSSEDERRITVSMDTLARADVDAADFSQRFEKGVVLAASITSHLIAEGAELRLELGREGGEFGAGREHLHSCLRRLATVEPVTGSSNKTSTYERVTSLYETPIPQRGFMILLTSAEQGSIPAEIWRSAHVIYF